MLNSQKDNNNAKYEWTEKDNKLLFGAFVIGIVFVMQLYAWKCGYNGVIFSFSSLIIGSITGLLLGFKWGRNAN